MWPSPTRQSPPHALLGSGISQTLATIVELARSANYVYRIGTHLDWLIQHENS